MSRTIVVVKNRGLGDAVMGLSTLQFLVRMLPGTELHYAIPGWVQGLFDGRRVPFHSLIDSSFVTVEDSIRLWRRLVEIKPDFIFELNQEYSTACFFRLLSEVSGIPYFFHNHHLRGTSDIIHQGERRPSIQRDLDGVYSIVSRKLGLFSGDPPSFRDWTPDLGPSWAGERKQQIVFGVVASTATKRWPLASFARLSRLLHEENPDWKIIVPFSGSPDDQAIRERMASCDFSPQVQALRLELDALAGVLDGSLCYVGNDTGLKHVCVGLGVPTVTLFGPLDPGEWHPYDTAAHPTFFETDMPCRYQHGEACLLAECASMACLDRFTPEAVAAQAVASVRQAALR